MAWEIKLVGDETVVDGVAKNLRYAVIEEVEVWISVVDAAGETIARSVCYIVPHQVRQGEVAPFSLKLPVVVASGMLLKFAYRYDGSDGGDGGVSWMQSFDWIVPTP